MNASTKSDARAADIEWRDLLALSPTEVLRDLVIWVPWLALAWVSITLSWWALILPAYFFFFLTGLRQAHEAFHRNMGLPAWACDLTLVVLSPLMLTALHATRYIHLRHHRYCLGPRDVEGEGASLPAWRAVVQGIVYPLKSHGLAWREGGARIRRFMLIEAAVIFVFYAAGLWLRPELFGVHLGAMVIAEWWASFFAVWMVHHDCEHKPDNPSRTIRGVWRGIFTYNMFYHAEHHALPRVPTRRLPTLARRFDLSGGVRAPRAF